jgi:hypothetical protein
MEDNRSAMSDRSGGQIARRAAVAETAGQFPRGAGWLRRLAAQDGRSLTGQMVPSHLKQAGSAISAVEQVEELEHDRTSLFDQCKGYCAETVSGRFRVPPKTVSSGLKMVSSEPEHRDGAVEMSGGPVDSCAASICERERILARGLVDMLRISTGNRSRRQLSCETPRFLSATPAEAFRAQKIRAIAGRLGTGGRSLQRTQLNDPAQETVKSANQRLPAME